LKWRVNFFFKEFFICSAMIDLCMRVTSLLALILAEHDSARIAGRQSLQSKSIL
jgi:hypothetical protein